MHDEDLLQSQLDEIVGHQDGAELRDVFQLGACHYLALGLTKTPANCWLSYQRGEREVEADLMFRFSGRTCLRSEPSTPEDILEDDAPLILPAGCMIKNDRMNSFVADHCPDNSALNFGAADQDLLQMLVACDDRVILLAGENIEIVTPQRLVPFSSLVSLYGQWCHYFARYQEKKAKGLPLQFDYLCEISTDL